MGTQLVMYEEEFTKINAVCDRLTKDANAKVVFLVDKNGVVKVADFGLVKDAARGEAADTGGTAIVGTPLYMAPEQARGDPVDSRADIFALGAVLHEMAAGRPAVSGASPAASTRRNPVHPAAVGSSRNARSIDGTKLTSVTRCSWINSAR